MVTAVNRPRSSIYQYYNMAPKLSGQTSIFGVVLLRSKPLLGTARQKKLKKFTILTRKPRNHVRILGNKGIRFERPQVLAPHILVRAPRAASLCAPINV